MKVVLMSKHNPQRPDQALRARSAQLRHEQTPCEQILWQHLRGGKLGVKVRRQHPVGRFIADFCCIERRLIIEVDGPVHLDQADRDTERTLFLEAAGYRVLRFTNAQVLHETEDVLQAIRATLAGSRPLDDLPSPPLPPLPPGGRGGAQPYGPADPAQPAVEVPPLPQAGEGDRGVRAL